MDGSSVRTGPPPPPPPPELLNEAARNEAMAAQYQQQVEMLSHEPLTPDTLESQIQALLEGQRSLRYELQEVRSQVDQNYHAFEALRQSHDSGSAYTLPQHMDQQHAYYQAMDFAAGQPGHPPGSSQLPMAEAPPSYGPTSLGGSVGGVEPVRFTGFPQQDHPRNLGYHENHLENITAFLTPHLETVGNHISTHAGHLHRRVRASIGGSAGGNADEDGSPPRTGRRGIC